MSSAPEVSFANVVVRFGDKFVLLDLAKEIVLPAFSDRSLRRVYGPSSYFFLDVKTTEVPLGGATTDPLLVVFGKIVKDTLLTREQVFDRDSGQLLPATGTMPSAPSSFFALILNNHKLVFMPETSYAPTLGAFQATLQKFLSAKYKNYIDVVYRASLQAPAPKNKKELYLEIPHPSVEVRPLASRGSITDFLAAFDKVTRLEFSILESNDELQHQRTYQDFRQIKAELKAQKARVLYESTTGLEKAEAAEEIHAAAASGNQTVKIAGRAPGGAKMSGDNENLTLRIPSADIPRDETQRMIIWWVCMRPKDKAVFLSKTLAETMQASSKTCAGDCVMDEADINPVDLTAVPDLSDLFSEESLWESYQQSTPFYENRFNRRVFISAACVLSVFACVHLAGIGGTTGNGRMDLLATFATLAGSGLSYSSTILGFLLAGFAILFTVLQPQTAFLLTRRTRKGAKLNDLKRTFVSFIALLADYITFCFWCIAYTIAGGKNGPIELLGRQIGTIAAWAPDAVAHLVFVLWGLWYLVLVLKLKSFVFTLYQSLLLGLASAIDDWYDAQRQDTKP